MRERGRFFLLCHLIDKHKVNCMKTFLDINWIVIEDILFFGNDIFLQLLLNLLQNRLPYHDGDESRWRRKTFHCYHPYWSLILLLLLLVSLFLLFILRSFYKFRRYFFNVIFTSLQDTHKNTQQQQSSLLPHMNISESSLLVTHQQGEEQKIPLFTWKGRSKNRFR